MLTFAKFETNLYCIFAILISFLVNYPRWCKLRGNLLFYLKDHDPLSQPAGVVVLENCRPLIKSEEREFDGYVFILGKLKPIIHKNPKTIM